MSISIVAILSLASAFEIGGAITDPAVCDAIKRIEGRLDKESQLRKTIEFLKGKIVPEF